MQLLQKLVINPTSLFYSVWTLVECIVSIQTAMIYPYCLAYGFPNDFSDSRLI